jgi:hypothetical protein
MKPSYRAVDAVELQRVLGSDCSPDASRKGYVIGPDVTGRLCHCGSYRSMRDAVEAAERFNAARPVREEIEGRKA